MLQPTPAEKKLKFKGFSKPEWAFRVSSGRVAATGCLAVVTAIVGLFLIASPFVVEAGPDAKAPWLIYLIGFGGGGGMIFFAVWMAVRATTGSNQRMLLYPEGIVAWRDGKPVAYRWKDIASVSRKREDPGPRNRALVMLAMTGKDLIVTIKFEDEDEEPLVLTGMLGGLEFLASEMKERINPPDEYENEDEAATGEDGDANPFGNLH